MRNFGPELLIIAFEIQVSDLAVRALLIVPILAIFARILLLQNLVQRAAAGCLWVVSSLANLSNEWRFVQRVSTVVFGWVDKLSRFPLVCFDYLSTQPT